MALCRQGSPFINLGFLGPFLTVNRQMAKKINKSGQCRSHSCGGGGVLLQIEILLLGSALPQI